MRVVVALSGGVDSAVAASILKRQGHEVIGVHMRNWDATVSENRDECAGRADQEDVKKVCELLQIPLHVYNFSVEYWEDVFCPYLEDLSGNLNTNPDIRCNARIKFGVLLDRVMEDFGPNAKLATGHWARIAEEEGRFRLEVCSNAKKDQTYFLSSLKEKQLARVLFPLENVESKEGLRTMAKEMGLHNWDKRDSVGICFIGRRNYRDFIGNYIEAKEGDFVDVEDGRVLGRHRGTHLYVLHQRDGLHLRGYGEKYYVCGKDAKKNVVYLCRKSQVEKYLYSTRSRCERLQWISGDLMIREGEEIYIKARHSPEFLKVRVLKMGKEHCLLGHEKMYVTTPGQAIVFYRDRRRCLGMGIYVVK